MNFSSILNNDPPAADEAPAGEKKPLQPRHSLLNLLNDSSASSEPVSTPNKNVSNGRSQDSEAPLQDQYKVPKPVINSPSIQSRTPSLMKRNSIANITNDTDVDITTGKQTLNASHHQHDDVKTEGETDEKDDVSESSIYVEEKGEVEEKKEGAKQNGVKSEELKGGVYVPPHQRSNKPKRYSKPPIWAQEWIPGNHAQNGAIEEEPVSSETALSSKHVFENANLVSLDLECSITGTIPPQSVTRTIAEWIYANFTEISDDQRKNIELELKFGSIIDKRTGQRLAINVSTECIYTDVSNITFELGVHEVGFNILCKFLEEIEKSYQDDLRKHPSKEKPRRKFNMLESDITDTFYNIIQRNEPVSKIRISKDNLLSPPRFTAINKRRISDLYIHNPSSMYDLRLSLSHENPVPENEIDSIRKKNSPILTRVKKRSTWSHRQTATRFDMTRVLTPKQLRNNTGKKIIDQEQSFEVELEVDTHELFAGFDKFKSGQDAIRFEELVEIFINNGRCLNNRVTKVASK